jgi:hypothetical protein
MAADLDERFVRWQGQAIGQLTFAINVFVGFSVGALAYVLSYLRETTFIPEGCYAKLYVASVVLLCMAGVLGLGAVVTRLLDFRATAQSVRLRGGQAASSEVAASSRTASHLGKATWTCFWSMLVCFFFGVAFFTASLVSVYGSRILSAAKL